MNRAECEEKIIEEFKKIVEIYHQYNPAGTYLTLAYLDDDWMHVNNRYYNEESPDYEFPIIVNLDI